MVGLPQNNRKFADSVWWVVASVFLCCKKLCSGTCWGKKPPPPRWLRVFCSSVLNVEHQLVCWGETGYRAYDFYA